MSKPNSPDPAHVETDDVIARLERRIVRIFSAAASEVREQAEAYFASFEAEDKQQKAKLDAGKITEQAYIQWRLTKIARGKRFEALQKQLAERMTNAHEVAIAYVNDATPGVYSLNRNYAAYTIEKNHGDIGFTLWNEQTVRKLVKEQPDLMPYYPPEKAVERGIDLANGKLKIMEYTRQGILMGESLPGIAKRLMDNLPKMDRTAAIRAARTAMTRAQNAGRQDSYEYAAQMGIKVRKRWMATRDFHTRHAHGDADSQVVDYNEPFQVGGQDAKHPVELLMFPGDESLGASGWNLYNCRCRCVTEEPENIRVDPVKMRVRGPDGKNYVVNEMTYNDWKEWVKERS